MGTCTVRKTHTRIFFEGENAITKRKPITKRNTLTCSKGCYRCLEAVALEWKYVFKREGNVPSPSQYIPEGRSTVISYLDTFWRADVINLESWGEVSEKPLIR